MNLSRFSLLLLVTIPMLLLSACGCPPDKQIGELELTANSRTWIPYSGGETLVFVNANNQELRLKNPAGVDSQRNQLCTKTICTEQKIKGESTCEFYSSESKRFIFRSDDQNYLMDLLYYSEVYDPGEKEFVDIMRVSMSSGTAIGSAELVTDQHFTGNLDPNRLSLMTPLVNYGTVTLDSVAYQNVYGDTTQNAQVFFSAARGLVGFRLNGETWRLQ